MITSGDMSMEDYKEMYYLLFNKITDTIAELQAVQRKAEELFISPDMKEVSNRSLKNIDALRLRERRGRDT